MSSTAGSPIAIALCGDVMTARGIDQILPHPGDPRLHESYVLDARDYVALAKEASGPFPIPADFEYVWGDALPALRACDVRIVNLETSITRTGEPAPAKGIHYRMHPSNAGCLTAARLDCCGLANNHVLDWGRAGLEETLRTLREAGISCAGAGLTRAQAAAPAAVTVANRGRVLVVAAGSATSGIPLTWAADERKPGINLVGSLDVATARRLAQDLLRISRPDDITVVSIHWGGNWGYEIPAEQIEFAHALAEEGVDVIHGHSSHHAKAIELRGNSVILYGCGDFLNDYEGIGGREEFRGDLALLYRVKVLHQPRRPVELSVVPFQLRRFRLNHASTGDAKWIASVLQRECARFGTTVNVAADNSMTVLRL